MVWLIVSWYLIGVVGCIIGTAVDLKKGEDFTAGGLFPLVLAAIAGPIILILSIVHLFDHIKINDIVIIKGKNK